MPFMQEKLLGMDLALWPVMVPLFTGVAVLFFPDFLRRWREGLVVIATCASAAVCIKLALLTDGANKLYGQGQVLSAGYGSFLVFSTDHAADLALDLDLRLDSLSAMALAGVGVFSFLCSLFSWGSGGAGPRRREFCAYFLWISAAAATAVMANGFGLLLVSWGAVTVLYFLLVTTAGEKATGAARKSFVMLAFGDACLLLAVAVAWAAFGCSGFFGVGARAAASSIDLAAGWTAYAVFFGFAAAALARAGAWPLHTWTPESAERSPAVLSAYVPVGLNMILGVYLLARVTGGLFPAAEATCAGTALMALGAVTALFCASASLVQTDMKRLLAYLGASQVGLVALGLGTGGAGAEGGGGGGGGGGAELHAAGSVVFMSCLFLCAGAVEKRARSTRLSELGGLAGRMPGTFLAALVAGAAAAGAPLFGGFTGRWLIYLGLLRGSRAGGLCVFLVAVAAFTAVIVAASVVRLLHAVFLGREPSARRLSRAPESFERLTMGVPLAVLAGLCLVMGYLRPGAAGIFEPGVALVGAVVAAGVGLAIYAICGVFEFRLLRPFMGGERTGTVEGQPGRVFGDRVRVGGAHFYEDAFRGASPVLARCIRDATRGAYDVYVLAGAAGGRLVRLAVAAHEGALTTYLACLAVGLMAIVLVLMRGYLW